MSYKTHSFLVGPLSGQRSIDEVLYRKNLKFVYAVMNSNNSIVAHIGQLIRQSAKSPIGGNVACFRYKFGVVVDDNVLKNLRLISRYFELNGERNITASIAIDLQFQKTGKFHELLKKSITICLPPPPHQRESQWEF